MIISQRKSSQRQIPSQWLRPPPRPPKPRSIPCGVLCPRWAESAGNRTEVIFSKTWRLNRWLNWSNIIKHGDLSTRFFLGFSLATHVFFFARWSIGIWEGETIEISPSTMMGDQFMGEDIWGQVWATLWRGSCEDCCSVSFLNLIQRALTPAIFIRFTSKMAWYSPDAVAVEDNHETQTKSWTLQWFWLGLESGLICFCICEKRPVPEYPNELGEVVLSNQLGGKWWGLRSSLPGLIPFAFVCKREKQHRLIWSTNLPMCKVHKMRQHYTIRIDSPFFWIFLVDLPMRKLLNHPHFTAVSRMAHWYLIGWFKWWDEISPSGVARNRQFFWCFWNQSIWGRGWVIFKYKRRKPQNCWTSLGDFHMKSVTYLERSVERVRSHVKSVIWANYNNLTVLPHWNHG